MSKEYEPIMCERCKEPKSRLRDNGSEEFLKCRCSYIDAVLLAARTGIHEECLTKTMQDWNPPIFKAENAGAFKNLIFTQKAQAVVAIHEFAFKSVGVGKRLAIQKSVKDRETLFVRGPNGSGKGLLMASVKYAALCKRLSVTSASAQSYDDFKHALVDSKFHSPVGYEARAFVAEEYESVQLMTVEGLRGDYQYNMKGDNVKRSFSGVNDLDAMLARRLSSDGAMMFTSEEFCGQISDTLGDRLRDILSKDSCRLILMFSPREAEYLMDAIYKHRDNLFNNSFEQIVASHRGPGKKLDAKSKAAEREDRLLLDRVFYFEEAFPLPRMKENPLTGLSVGGGYPELVQDQWNRFAKVKLTKGLEYEEGIRMAQMDAVRACKLMADKMTEKELVHVGRLVSCAASDASMKELISKAKALRAEMTR